MLFCLGVRARGWGEECPFKSIAKHLPPRLVSSPSFAWLVPHQIPRCRYAYNHLIGIPGPGPEPHLTLPCWCASCCSLMSPSGVHWVGSQPASRASFTQTPSSRYRALIREPAHWWGAGVCVPCSLESILHLSSQLVSLEVL